MSIKKKVIISLGVGVLAIALTATSVFAAVGGTNLVLHGSTTLGPVIVNSETYFNSAGLGVTIDSGNLVQNSSGAGIGDLNASPQLCDIAMSSRALKTTGSPSEASLDTATPACDDAVVIMVNNLHTPTDITTLTKQQIRGIYEGVYKLSSNSDGTNQYWDAAAVTVSSSGIAGDDGVYYDKNASFPALPGYGNPADHVQIIVDARNLESGTRGFLGDTVAHGGCGFASGSSSSDPIYAGGLNTNASSYPLEEMVCGVNDTNRQTSATNMSTAINNATNAAIGYAGLGYDTGANIRDINVIDDLFGTDRTAYAATNINVYSNHYHLSRYCYLVTKNSDSNHANDMVFVNWFIGLDSAGQDAAVNTHELRLVPDEDINADGTISIYDLVQMGNDWLHTDATGPRFRSDINRDGVVNIYDLVDLGNWWGVNIQTLP